MNPYAPPQHPAAQPLYSHSAPARFVAVARHEDLVVSKWAPLPDVCMKCGANGPVERRVRLFTYTPGWAFLTLFIGLIVGLIIISTIQVTGGLNVPLCAACDRRWRQADTLKTVALVALIGVALAVSVALGVSMSDTRWIGPILVLASAIVVIPMVILNHVVLRSRTLWTRGVNAWYITLGGTHPAAREAACAYAAYYGGSSTW